MGTARCNGQNILLSQEERLQASAVLLELQKKYDNRISAMAGPLARGAFFSEVDRQRALGRKKIPGAGTLSSCGGVFHKMAVLHDGNMVPCNMLPSLTMGTIGEVPLRDAWLHHSSINVVRRRREIPLASLADCSDCEFTGFCFGGCPAVAMAGAGTLNAVDPASCYRMYLRQGVAA
jgi:radical SAM protein with 4Fe4S-binding SPASM domain